MLLFDPKAQGSILANSYLDTFDYYDIGSVKALTHISTAIYPAFSFWPTCRRLKDYKLLKGYNYLTYNTSFAKGVGANEDRINDFYTMRGYHNVRIPFNFYHHVGGANPSPVKFWEKDWRLTVLYLRYGKFLSKNKNEEEMKKNLTYLIQRKRFNHFEDSVNCNEGNDSELQN